MVACSSPRASVGAAPGPRPPSDALTHVGVASTIAPSRASHPTPTSNAAGPPFGASSCVAPAPTRFGWVPTGPAVSPPGGPTPKSATATRPRRVLARRLGSSAPVAANARRASSVVSPVAATQRATVAAPRNSPSVAKKLARLVSLSPPVFAFLRSAAALSSIATRMLAPSFATYPAAISARAVAVASSKPATTDGSPPDASLPPPPPPPPPPLADTISATALRHMRDASSPVSARAKYRSTPSPSSPPTSPSSPPTSPSAALVPAESTRGPLTRKPPPTREPANASQPPGNAGTAQRTSHRSGAKPGSRDAVKKSRIPSGVRRGGDLKEGGKDPSTDRRESAAFGFNVGAFGSAARPRARATARRRVANVRSLHSSSTGSVQPSSVARRDGGAIAGGSPTSSSPRESLPSFARASAGPEKAPSIRARFLAESSPRDPGDVSASADPPPPLSAPSVPPGDPAPDPPPESPAPFRVLSGLSSPTAKEGRSFPRGPAERTSRDSAGSSPRGRSSRGAPTVSVRTPRSNLPRLGCGSPGSGRSSASNAPRAEAASQSSSSSSAV